jgi:hypothetical protein
MTDKSSILKAFNNHFFDFLLDFFTILYQSVFAIDFDIDYILCLSLELTVREIGFQNFF